MSEISLFAATYVLVFFLGLQNLHVVGGHYKSAFITSVGIGACQMILLKLGPDASATEIAAFLAGGPFGIVTSMWIYRRTLGRIMARRGALLKVESPYGKDAPADDFAPRSRTDLH